MLGVPRPPSRGGTCEAAATAHHFDEVVQYRLATGILGAVVLAGVFVVRRSRRFARRVPLGDGVGLLPDGFVVIVGTAVFGCAAGVLVLDGLGQLVGRGGGAGDSLSAGIVAAVIATVFAMGLFRTLSIRALIVDDPVL